MRLELNFKIRIRYAIQLTCTSKVNEKLGEKIETFFFVASVSRVGYFLDDVKRDEWTDGTENDADKSFSTRIYRTGENL